jgi:hypothetical protein
VVTSSIPGIGSRTFSDLAMTSDLGVYVKGDEPLLLRYMDLVVIHDGTHAAHGTTQCLLLLVVIPIQ